MSLISSIDSRLVYRNALAAFKAANIQVNKSQLSNAYLRFEVPLNATQTAYEVPITITQQNGTTGIQSITEQRLELQDSFFISHLGYFLNSPTTNGGTGLKDQLFTFPSMMFDGYVNTQTINKFWNGFLRLTVNNTVICPQWDLQRHYYAPETQRPYNAWVAQPFAYTDQRDGSQDGFYPVEPNWVLIGSRNNQMQINYPSAFDSTVITGGNTELKAVIIARGVLAQNSTPVR